MTLTIIKQNILNINKGIIAHQVNTKGVMGAGLAKQIAEKYPTNYHAYRDVHLKNQLVMGGLVVTGINSNLYIANLVAQSNYGRDKQYTDYQYLTLALDKLFWYSCKLNLIPYIPYRLGCGLGGGDWSIVFQLISHRCPNAIICQL